MPTSAWWTPERREAASLRWTPKKRRTQSRIMKQVFREIRFDRLLWAAMQKARQEGWEACEWPRWPNGVDHPPSYGRAEREWLLVLTTGNAELERWRRKVADMRTAQGGRWL